VRAEANETSEQRFALRVSNLAPVEVNARFARIRGRWSNNDWWHPFTNPSRCTTEDRGVLTVQIDAAEVTFDLHA
jgi:hypothetical protein